MTISATNFFYGSVAWVVFTVIIVQFAFCSLVTWCETHFRASFRSCCISVRILKIEAVEMFASIYSDLNIFRNVSLIWYETKCIVNSKQNMGMLHSSVFC
jgi:hypothetical protein